jgi:hypothetical protein
VSNLPAIYSNGKVERGQDADDAEGIRNCEWDTMMSDDETKRSGEAARTPTTLG